MEVRIGIVQSMKEITVEVSDATALSELEDNVGAAISASTMLWLVDDKGRRVGVPGDRIAYVELTRASERPVGFGAA